MTKVRQHITREIRDKVLHEYNHRCAVCGTDKPQIHHIDENPSNNDVMNLIPLCPNCHLIDQHNPTRVIGPEKLRLFRQFKDPSILKPQFHPLFTRLQFLDLLDENDDAEQLYENVKELISFVADLQMGSFYSQKIQQILRKPSYAYGYNPDDYTSIHRVRLEKQQHDKEYREKVRKARDQVYEVAVELLRFQNW